MCPNFLLAIFTLDRIVAQMSNFEIVFSILSGRDEIKIHHIFRNFVNGGNLDMQIFNYYGMVYSCKKSWWLEQYFLDFCVAKAIKCLSQTLLTFEKQRHGNIPKPSFRYFPTFDTHITLYRANQTPKYHFHRLTTWALTIFRYMDWF